MNTSFELLRVARDRMNFKIRVIHMLIRKVYWQFSIYNEVFGRLLLYIRNISLSLRFELFRSIRRGVKEHKRKGENKICMSPMNMNVYMAVASPRGMSGPIPPHLCSDPS